jgi:hypothetical protein
MNTAKFLVFKVYRKSAKKKILFRNLTEGEAQRIVNSYPNAGHPAGKRNHVAFPRRDGENGR